MRPDHLTERLTREIHEMPAEVADALERNGLRQAYEARPAYQQNDYIGWINRAKRPETRQKRLEQMLEELATGGVYMRMKWSPQRR
ncbi:MAG TPA: YdeI/OmpD-associated family protein [Devosiaceae bacterium]|nr:YdeI/OmpD-associated family protein [Devosiaceae bacterium]